jgi:hypothetical protein
MFFKQFSPWHMGLPGATNWLTAGDHLAEKDVLQQQIEDSPTH